MELTGYATDFIVDLSLPSAMVRFVRSARRRWPGLFLDGEYLTPEAWQTWELDPPQDATTPAAVTFTSGKEMEDFWEENGYALDPSSGQGPYAVFYRRSQPPLEPGFVVSVVTPANPDTDPFSLEITREFMEAFEGERPGAVRHA
ncbi:MULTISPECIES: hypothetical protein [unclassified Streptomyces]|uniref:hypothetical protein n=1 Tax=unclassified Streptomyces TaxID=2593676 RepID=UPI003D721ECC